MSSWASRCSCASATQGRLLPPGEFVPPAVVDFIGRQLDLAGDELADYTVRSETLSMVGQGPECCRSPRGPSTSGSSLVTRVLERLQVAEACGQQVPDSPGRGRRLRCRPRHLQSAAAAGAATWRPTRLPVRPGASAPSAPRGPRGSQG